MDTKDITKGQAFVIEYAGSFAIQSTNFYEETDLLNLDNHKEAESNAELFKEAFNVANETGLSPTQMRDRIKEMEGEIQSLKENPICGNCNKYKTFQGDGVIHQLCECNQTALNNKQK